MSQSHCSTVMGWDRGPEADITLGCFSGSTGTFFLAWLMGKMLGVSPMGKNHGEYLLMACDPRCSVSHRIKRPELIMMDQVMKPWSLWAGEEHRLWGKGRPDKAHLGGHLDTESHQKREHSQICFLISSKVRRKEGKDDGGQTEGLGTCRTQSVQSAFSSSAFDDKRTY